MSDVTIVEPTVPQAPIDWRAIFAGAVVAAGISFTLLAFGSAIGLSVASTGPSWRDSSSWLALLSGVYLLFTALCAFGFGGYVAGRLRGVSRSVVGPESQFRDGMHGIVTWGLAVMFSGLVALGGIATATRTMPTGGAYGAAASSAGESVISSELDELFRGDRGLADNTIQYRRAEAARILLKASSHSGVSQDDRTYLADVINGRVGLPPIDALGRVNRVVDETADELHRARTAAVLQAFMIAAALLIGAAVSWFAAVEGGHESDSGVVPAWQRRPVVR